MSRSGPGGHGDPLHHGREGTVDADLLKGNHPRGIDEEHGGPDPPEEKQKGRRYDQDEDVPPPFRYGPLRRAVPDGKPSVLVRILLFR
ncbi:hypothetical protein SDC9_88153 [bioreactor metagenome]|uniref:Uncharacterized protein n=1 Tax=bioreactor metagenome TaxID=1076179 RepID=A0A644ZMA6_9ZZZZ